MSLDFPGQQFVTIGLDNVEFKHPIRQGQILRFVCQKTRVGNTSVTYQVQVFGARYQTKSETVLFENNISFVCINHDGNKTTINNS